VPDGAPVDLSLVKLQDDALIFPTPGEDLSGRETPAASPKSSFAARAS
jgi:hypothetical protein